jgi:ABC-type sugar transport system substrate-binding protein
MGVDAINVTSVSPAAAEYSCRLANEAKIPIQITESGIAEGKGKPFADVDFNWFEIYRTVARGLRKDVKGDLSVVWVQGFAGTPPVMQGIEGFKDEITKQKGIKLATDVQYGNYATEVTLPLMKTVIQSGVDFNVAIGACQEITEGIITAVKEEKVDRKSVTIVTVNGGPMDIENFKDGDLDYCLSLSPGLHGMICAANVIAYLDKKTYQKKSYSPIVWCNKNDWQQKLIPWGMDETWVPVVDEFVKTGQYKPELKGK